MSPVSVTGLAQAGAAITAAFSLATFAGPWHRNLDLFAHFRLQYLIAAASFAVLLFVLRSPRWALAMAAVAAIDLAPVAPWYFADAVAPARPAATLRVLLSNVHASNRDTDRLIELIRAEAPDVVFLQEVTARRLDELQALAVTYPYVHAAPREDNFGIAVLARHPFRSVVEIDSAPFGFPTLVVEFDVGGRTVTAVTTHPMIPLGETNYAGQAEQLDDVATLIASRVGPRLVVGDLNATMWGHLLRRFREKSGLVNARRGFGVLATWPKSLGPAGIPIDHCFASRDFRVADFRTGPDIGSDHLPLIVDLSLAGT